MERRKELNDLIWELSSNQLGISEENIGFVMGDDSKKEQEAFIAEIEYQLKQEILIFDGKQSLFFKRTGLMIWEPFK